MRVSVIIPVFNDQEGLNRCLRGMREQTWPSDALEVIVVDNGSEPPLAAEGPYPFAVQFIRCERPGSYAARNAGVAVAHGKVLAFIDADCWPDSRWIECGINALLGRKGPTIIGGHVAFALTEDPTAVARYQAKVGFGQGENICKSGFAATANLFCSQSQMETVGGFDERLLSGGDREWCRRAVASGLEVDYASGAIVYTEPRSTLMGAIRQARRVAAGRRQLQKLGLPHIDKHSLGRRRSIWSAAQWILSNHELRFIDRWKVLGVATVIRLAGAAESFLLQLGTKPERR